MPFSGIEVSNCALAGVVKGFEGFLAGEAGKLLWRLREFIFRGRGRCGGEFMIRNEAGHDPQDHIRHEWNKRPRRGWHSVRAFNATAPVGVQGDPHLYERGGTHRHDRPEKKRSSSCSL